MKTGVGMIVRFFVNCACLTLKYPATYENFTAYFYIIAKRCYLFAG